MSSFRGGRRNEAFFQAKQDKQHSSLPTILRHARLTGTLSITGKDLSEVPLEIFSNELEEGEKFWECEPITQLDLSFNSIGSVGPQMGAFPEAVMMKFRGNRIAELAPEVFEQSTLLKHLDLSQNNLRELVDSVSNLTELRVLLLSDNLLGRLPLTLQNCQNLQDIDFHNNQLAELPDLALPRLKKMRISKNQLTSLPKGLSSCEMLEMLDCKSNRLRSLPSLAKLQNLKVLDAMENLISVFPELPLVNSASGPGSGLEILNLSYNGISSLSPTLVLHDRLSDLHLQNNKLVALDGGMVDMASLKLLDASNNSLTDVPYQLGYSPSLSQLLIDGNPIRTIRRTLITRQGANCTETLKEFLRSRGDSPLDGTARGKGGGGVSRAGPGAPAASSKVSSIDIRIRDVVDRGGTLDIRECGLIPLIPRELFVTLFESNVLASLTRMDASSNSISVLPLELAQTPVSAPLSSLNFRGNHLGRGVEGGLSLSWAPTTLTSLDVSDNGLSSAQLGTIVSEVANLQHLEASGNALTSWPEVSNRTSKRGLREVRLSNNRLTDLASFDASAFSQLEILDLSGNSLREVMDVDWASLEKLNTLDLSNNDISSVPYQLGFLRSLEKLNLYGNPTRMIRQTLVQGPTAKLKEFLRSRAPAS